MPALRKEDRQINHQISQGWGRFCRFHRRAGCLQEKTKVSAFSRDKGKRGELEVAGIIRDLLGLEAKRRVRQHDGDSDVMGVPGWSIEVKNCASITLPAWWRQTVAQALDTGDMPVLFYKIPRKGWRCVWSASAVCTPPDFLWTELEYACESSPAVWAALVRESGSLL
jgi:hypothetical protein